MSDPVSGAVAGGAALLGGALGSQKSGGQTQTQTSAPWGPQQPYIEQGFGTAQQILGSQGLNPVGQFVASGNPIINQGYGQGYNAGTAAAPMYGTFYNASQTLGGSDQQNKFVGTSEGIADNGIGGPSANTALLSNYAQTGSLPGGSSTINTGLQSGIDSAAANGLGSLAGASGLAEQSGRQALNTAGNLGLINSEANSFASNPTLAAQIASQEAQVQDSLTTQSLPSIQAGAAAAGNANSSREGALEGQAIKGADLADAQISSNLTANAYNTGANLANSQITNGENAATAAASTLNSNGSIGGNLGLGSLGLEQNNTQFGTNSRLNAASTGGQQDLAYGVDNTNARLSANGQIENGIQSGVGILNSALAGGVSAGQAQSSLGQNEQQQQQLSDNNNVALAQQPWSQLGNYWNIVGKPEGTQQTSTVTPNNGGFGGAAAGALGLGSAAYGAYQNGAFNGLFGSGSNFAGSSGMPLWQG